MFKVVKPVSDNMRQVQPEMLLKNSNLPVYKISSLLKIPPPKTPNSFHIRYRTLFHFYLKKNQLEFRLRSHDFSFNLFPVWQPYCWRFWSAIVPMHTSTINAPLGSVLLSCYLTIKNVLKQQPKLLWYVYTCSSWCSIISNLYFSFDLTGGYCQYIQTDSDTENYRLVWRDTHYVVDKNNPFSFEVLDIHYHNQTYYYPEIMSVLIFITAVILLYAIIRFR
jgi:hypothetical protein